MTPLLKSNPEVLNKVHVVSGNLPMPNLGMSDEDVKIICGEASIVFHVAADTDFTKTFRTNTANNCLGTYNVVELCKKMKQLDVLVYTSTAFSNSHRFPEKTKEIVYPMDHPPQRYLDELENGSDESFAELASSCNTPWPNSYTFSKCLAENIIKEKAVDLPWAIVRPSVVFCTQSGSLPGYMEGGSVVMTIIRAVSKGYLRLARMSKSAIVQLIPVDVVGNSHIVAAWKVATGRSPSMLVVNCTAGEVYKVSWAEFFSACFEAGGKYPLKNRLQKVSVTIVESKFMYHLLSVYEHYIPTVVLDMQLRLKGSKLRFWDRYKYYNKKYCDLDVFLSRQYDMDTKNFESLSRNVPPEEAEVIYTEVNGDVYEYTKNFPYACKTFVQNLDTESPQKHRRAVVLRTMLIDAIRKCGLFLMCYLIYLFVFKVLL